MHTPGPWKNRRDLIGKITTEKGDSIAIVCINDGVSAKQSFANAQLIASAPELLDACQCLLAIIGRLAPKLEGMIEVDFARKVIAKATGK